MLYRGTASQAKFIVLAGFLAMALTLASCSRSNKPRPPPPPPPVTVTSVDVAAQAGEFATATEVAKGTVVLFNATANLSDGSTEDIALTSDWVSSDPAILAFDIPSVPGVATAKKTGGPVTVTATDFGGTAGTMSYTVAAAALEKLAVSPAQLPNGVPIGQEGNFKATYTLTDKSTSDATMDVDWSSSAAGIVVVGNDVGNKGKAVALSAGTSKISASKGTLRSQDVEITVGVPTGVPQFVVAPSSPQQLPLARMQGFQALLKYADNKVVDVTERVVWQSSDESIAKFPADFPKGVLLASPTTTGAVMITAQDPASTVQTAPVTVNVSNIAIEAIVIKPGRTADKPLSPGGDRQLGVLALYADKKVRDITQTVDWTTTASYMTVTNNTGSKGLVRVNQPRPAGEAIGTIVITDPISMQSVNVAIDTTGRTLARIEIAPADNKMLPRGFTQQFQASAIYSNGDVDVATDDVAWQTSDGTTVAISNNIPADNGKATALKEGAALISAAVLVDGKKFVSNSVVVTVTPATLVSMAIMPTTAVDLSVGGTQRLTAEGTFSDGSKRDVTSLVNWRSTDTGVVTVETSGKAIGTVRGVAVVGSPATINAFEPRLSVIATKPISVSAKMEFSLGVTPAGITSMPAGIPFAYEAILSFSDTTLANVSTQVAWTSNDPAIATISNEGGREGKITGKTVGDVTVTASRAGLTSAPVTFRVLAGTLTAIEITPPAQVGANVGDTVNFTAQGTYSDGSTPNITKTVVWNSDEPGKVVISSTDPDKGKAVAKGSGLATITASKDGVTSPGTSVVVAPQMTYTTVLEITQFCCAGQTVTMKGRATSWEGDEDYRFEDGSGPSIELEWEGTPTIPLDQEVLVTGVPETSGLEVDVSSWTPSP